MLKIFNMKPFESLDEILGSVVKVKIMRHMVTGHEGKTGRGLSLIASVSQPTAMKALEELVAQGVLTKKIVGKSYSFNLNNDNIIVKEGLIPLFRLENNLLGKFAKELQDILKDKILSALIYGSIARGNSTNTSDWDILLLCDEKEDINKLRETISNELTTLAKIFSSNLDIKIMSVPEFHQRLTSGDSLATNIYQDVIESRVPNPILGLSITELLRSSNDKT
ncbi:MAG: nucleotidyltransferase domain-containing protein [Pseudomonadota bacterium]